MRIQRTINLTVLCLAALVATGCGGSSSGSGSGSGGSGGGGGTITIGASVPLSGDVAVYGQDYVHGATIAIDEINAAGGINGHKLLLDAQDDAGSAAQAATVAHKLVDSSAVAVIGPELTAQVLAAAPVYASANLATFVAASGTEIADQGHSNIFQVSYRDNEAGPYDAQTLLTVLHAKKTYVLTDGSTYAVGVAQAMEATYRASGGTIVGSGQITDGQNDYTAALARAKASGAEAFYYPGYPPEAARLVKQGVGLGIKSSQWVLGGPTFDPALLKIAGSAANGVTISGTTPAPQLEPAAQAYVKAYTAKFHTGPSVFGQWAYDTINFLARQFKGLPYPLQRAAVVQACHADHSFVGVSGPFGFESNGVRSVAPLVRMTVRHGQFAVLSK